MITILNLSDIHLGTINQAQKYFMQIKSDLVNELKIKKLDYIVASGDIANYSTPEDYEASVDLFSQLIDNFMLDSDKVIVVPGLYVTNNDFSKEAKEYATSTRRISAMTYKALEQKIIDPDLYFTKRIYDYPNSKVYNTYVDLQCSKNYNDINETAEDSILGDIYDKNINFILLLGEYGSGKSTILKHIEYRLIREYQSSSVGRIPLFINLGEYTKALNLRQLMTDILVHRFGIKNPRYDIFKELNRNGRFVILFDGFDEMSSRTDDVIVRENFAEIKSLCVDNSKVILTCRTSFFRDREEEKSLLGAHEDKLLESIKGETKNRSNIYHLRPFAWSQIERVINRFDRYHKSLGKKRILSNILIERIKNTYNLEELAQRPFLLNMIIDSVPHIGTSLRSLTAGLLYEIYTDSWVHRDLEKGRVLETPNRRLFFAEELAYEMFLNSYTLLHWMRIPEWIDNHLGIKNKDKDYYEYDLRACNFLYRNEQGYYYFAHRSFLEFFVARKISKILCEDENFSVLSNIEIREEIRLFMKDLYGNSIADQLIKILYLVTFDSSQLNIEGTKLMVRNIISLFHQLGPIRVILPLMSYIRKSSERTFKSYLRHYLDDLFKKCEVSKNSESIALLIAVCFSVKNNDFGLNYDSLFQLWRKMPSIMKKEIEWAYSNVHKDRNTEEQERFIIKVLNRLIFFEGGLATVTTSEIAFALNIEENIIISLLKKVRAS